MNWKPFTGQRLETGDLLWIRDGLAYVGSSYTTGEPSTISYIPDEGGFTFENNGIHQRTSKGEADEFLEADGKFYYKRYKKRKKLGGQIFFVAKVKAPKL